MSKLSILIFSIILLKSAKSVKISCMDSQILESPVGEWVNSTINFDPSTKAPIALCTLNFTQAVSDALSKFGNVKDARVSVSIHVSPSADVAAPLVFTIRQQEDYKIVKLPMTYFEEPFSIKATEFPKIKWFYHAGGSLCLDQIDTIGHDDGRLLITVERNFGGSSHPVDIWIQVDVVPGLIINIDETVQTGILSPTMSTFFIVDLSQTKAENFTVIVRQLNDNKYCTMIAIQDPYCPMMDTQQTIGYVGKSQPMRELGLKFVNAYEMSVRKRCYKGGFAIIIVVLNDDTLCGSDAEIYDIGKRETSFSITVSPTSFDVTGPSQWFIWIRPFLIIGLTCLIPFLISFCLSKISGPPEPKVLRISLRNENIPTVANFIVPNLHNFAEGFWESMREYSINYFLALFVVIFFRILTLTKTTDLSECYYNKLCSYRWKLPFSSSIEFFVANSTFSSTAFVAVGIIYYIFIQSKWTPKAVVNANGEDLGLGGNYVFLDKSLALMLSLEGFMSAMYHVCNNASSFLIDAPIMDFIILIGWTKLHHLRHPLYMTVGLMSFVAVLNIIFEIMLTLAHYSHGHEEELGLYMIFLMGARCFYFNCLVFGHTFYIYHLGHLRRIKDEQLVPLIAPQQRPQQSDIVINFWEMMSETCHQFGLTLDRPLDFFMTLFLFAVNTGAIWTAFVLSINEMLPLELSSAILLLAEWNIMFGMLIHFLRKFSYEKLYYPDILSLCCFILYLGLHFFQLYKYELIQLFDWSGTHADSRDLNEECLDGIYDAHDYYHFYRATSLFFMGATLTTMNDGVVHFKRKDLRIF